MADKLTVAQVRKLFGEYDALADVKTAKSNILEKIAKGYGYGPFEQDGVRFKIRERKINGTDQTRFLLNVLESEEETTTL